MGRAPWCVVNRVVCVLSVSLLNYSFENQAFLMFSMVCSSIKSSWTPLHTGEERLHCEVGMGEVHVSLNRAIYSFLSLCPSFAIGLVCGQVM